MNYDTILQSVIMLLSLLTDTTEPTTEDSELIKDLGVSAMDLMFMIAKLEEEFHINIEENIFEKWLPSVMWSI